MRKSKKTHFLPIKNVRLKKIRKNHDLEHAIDQEKKSKF